MLSVVLLSSSRGQGSACLLCSDGLGDLVRPLSFPRDFSHLCSVSEREKTQVSTVTTAGIRSISLSCLLKKRKGYHFPSQNATKIK